MIYPRLVSVVAAGLLLFGRAPLHAQFRSAGERGDRPGWSPPAVGARVGFDNAQSRPMAGAFLRIPALPSGAIEILPSGDITFLPGLRQYQLNFEIVYLTGGRRGGLYLGGGTGIRRAVFSPDPNAPPENERTYSIVFGVRFGGLERIRPEVETRWILEDGHVRDPRLVSFGASVALW